MTLVLSIALGFRTSRRSLPSNVTDQCRFLLGIYPFSVRLFRDDDNSILKCCAGCDFCFRNRIPPVFNSNGFPQLLSSRLAGVPAPNKYFFRCVKRSLESESIDLGYWSIPGSRLLQIPHRTRSFSTLSIGLSSNPESKQRLNQKRAGTVLWCAFVFFAARPVLVAALRFQMCLASCSAVSMVTDETLRCFTNSFDKSSLRLASNPPVITTSKPPFHLLCPSEDPDGSSVN
jgi:hypothetical protein